MTTRRRKPKARTESAKRARGLPVVVSARYPQDLLAAIDSARGETPRQAWLVQAARDRLAREDGGT